MQDYLQFGLVHDNLKTTFNNEKCWMRLLSPIKRTPEQTWKQEERQKIYIKIT